MAGTIIVDRIESDASYASSINVAAQVTFSNTVNFGVSSVAPTAGVYSPSTNNLAFTTASTQRMCIDSSGRVGIGTTPSGSDGILTIRIDNIGFYLGYGASYDNYYTAGSSGSQIFRNGNTERMRINSSGYVTQPYQSYAQLVYTDGTGILRNNLVPWNGNRVNRNSAYNATTKLFTAPVAGIYFVSWANRRYDGFTAGTGDQLNIYKNGSQYMQSYYAGCVAGTVECAANDTISFFYNNDSGTVAMKEAYASIWLLG